MNTVKLQQASVGGFIRNKFGEVLFIKRSKNDSFLPGNWELPGGGVEYGENIEKTLRREIKEECGLDVEVGFPIAVDDYYMKSDKKEIQRIEIIFLCKLLNPNQTVVLSHEHSEFKWISSNKINNLELSSYMKNIINNALTNPISLIY